jgi:hypothetical protein
MQATLGPKCPEKFHGYSIAYGRHLSASITCITLPPFVTTVLLTSQA